MKIRFISLVLCLIMIVSLLAGCSEKSVEDAMEDAAAQNSGAKTLTMWIITENEKVEVVDKDGNPVLDGSGNPTYDFSRDVKAAMDAVEEAFAKETKKKYKTNVDIVFLTENEYYDKLESALLSSDSDEEMYDKASRALRYYRRLMDTLNPDMSDKDVERQFYIDFPEFWKYRNGKPTSSAKQEEEYVKNIYGVPELKYPDAKENQVDIIYLSEYERFKDYVDKGWIQELDGEISGTGNLLSTYITPALLNGVKYDGYTYAIPSNSAIGEYTYMLVDKALYDEFRFVYSPDLDLVDCEAFLNSVDAMYNADGQSILPIYSTFEEAMSEFVWYWDIGIEQIKDDNGNSKTSYVINEDSCFSIVGTLYGDRAKASRGEIALDFKPLFADKEYKNILSTLMSYKCNGYFGTPDEGQRVAIKYVKGDYTISSAIKNNNGVYVDENGTAYYAVVAKYPEVSTEEIYANMFAVSSTTENLTACVEIISALNTNSTLRNTLQYGVEGEHYKIDANGVLYREDINLDPKVAEYYLMDIKKTGNCFIAHPEEGLPADHWLMAQEQNAEAVVNPLLGFDFDKVCEDAGSLDKTLIQQLAAVNKDAWALLESSVGIEDVDALIDSFSSKFTGGTYTMPTGGVFIIDKLVTKEAGHPGGESPYDVYCYWMEMNGFAPQG